MKKILLSLSLLLMGISLSFGQVFSGLSHDFNDGSTMGWERGENEGLKLKVAADGSGSMGKLNTFSLTHWAGNYISEGIVGIRVSFSNPGSEDLKMRLAFGTSDNPKNGSWMSSTEAQIIPAGSMDMAVTFPIAETDLTSVVGSGSYMDVMENVAALRILHSNEPSARGDNIIATIHIDDITALDVLTAIDDEPTLADFRIYPNPVVDYAFISFEENSAISGEISINNLIGQTVMSLEINQQSGQQQIDLSGLKSGIYFLSINAEGARNTQKFIIR